MTPSSNTESIYKVDLYKCPHCGALKVLRSSYGCDFDGTVRWSDSKTYYPHIQKPSYVQHCPSCGGYFFRAEATLYKIDIYSVSNVAWGNLSYHSLRDAFEQLSPAGKDERQMRLMLLYAHNGLYGGCKGTKSRAEASCDEQSFFEENASTLISLANMDDPYGRLLTAELYREMGQFDEAVRVLREPFYYNLYLGLDAIRKLVLERAEQHDSNVFIVGGDRNHKREAVLVDDKDYLYDEDFEKNYIAKGYLPF